MKRKILIITEANETVATGHLYESAELARHIVNIGEEVEVFVNDNAEPVLKKLLPNYIEYNESVEIGYSKISDVVAKNRYSIVVTDLREISNKWIHKFKSEHDIPLVCIDEWGHRRLDCDVIINPMIGSYYWDYKGTKAKVYCGHEYLILPFKLQEYHKKEKIIRERVERVCVSMGGVDREGTTLKLLRYIENEIKTFCSMRWDIIIGAGFKFQEEFEKLIEQMEKIKGASIEGLTVYKNPNNIYELFYQADVAFCAGGNTLHELACIGTPTIIIPTVSHESNNGKEYERRGFGECLESTTSLSDNSIKKALSSIENYRIRKKMSSRGKKISDGMGCVKTSKLLLDEMRKKYNE